MKKYQTPKFEVQVFLAQDVVTASNPHDANSVLFKDAFDEYGIIG